MRFTLLAATIAAAGMIAHAAYAGEGNGDPFPFRAPGVTTTFNGYKALPPGLDDPYPFRAPGQAVSQSDRDRMAPAPGSQAPVQSANSLPVGFEDGPAAMYARTRPAVPSAVAQSARAGTHG